MVFILEYLLAEAEGDIINNESETIICKFRPIKVNSFFTPPNSLGVGNCKIAYLIPLLSLNGQRDELMKLISILF